MDRTIRVERIGVWGRVVCHATVTTRMVSRAVSSDVPMAARTSGAPRERPPLLGVPPGGVLCLGRAAGVVARQAVEWVGLTRPHAVRRHGNGGGVGGHVAGRSIAVVAAGLLLLVVEVVVVVVMVELVERAVRRGAGGDG